MNYIVQKLSLETAFKYESYNIIFNI
jgi:hypothetical protein